MFNRVVEQHGILAHVGDLATKIPERIVAERASVQANRAAVGFMESRQQAGKGGLTAARTADQSDRRTGRDIEIDFLQHRMVTVVAEIHCVESQRSARTIDRCIPPVGLRQHVELLEHILCGRQTALNDRIDLRELPDRLCQQSRRGDETDDVATGHAREKHGIEDQPDETCERHRHKELNDRCGNGARGSHAQVLTHVPRTRVLEARAFVRLGAVDTDLPMGGYGFRRPLRDVSHSGLDATGDPPETP